MTDDLTIQKAYDYWLIVWFYDDGEELHDPVPFTVGTDPHPWAESMFEYRKNKNATMQNGRVHICKGYKLLRLLPSEYSAEIEK